MNRNFLKVTMGLTSGILIGMAIDLLLKDRLAQILTGASDALIFIVIVAIIIWEHLVKKQNEIPHP